MIHTFTPEFFFHQSIPNHEHLHLEEPNPTKFLPSNDSPLFGGFVSSTQCKEGDVLIFPGRILHWTSPIQTPRWVIVFDIDLFS